MMLTRTLFLTVTAATASLAPSAGADELHREWVDPGAAFVLHFDWEGLQKTQIWKEVLEREDGDFDVDGFEEFIGEYGIDPRQDVRSLTVYSLSLGDGREEDAVVLLSATTKLDQALERAKEKPTYRTTSHEGLDLHVFSEDGDDDMIGYVHATPTGRLVVLSGNVQRVVQAARIVRGESPSHAQTEVPKLDLRPQPGSFLFLQAGGLGELEDFAPASKLFGMTQGFRLDVGESQGALLAHAAAFTGSPEDATNVADVLRGLKAMAALAGAEHPDLVGLTETLRIETRGSEVMIDFSLDVDLLMDQLQTLEDF